MRQEFADPGAGLAVLAEAVLARRDGEAFLGRGHASEPLAAANGIGQVLREPVRQPRLVVEQIEVRWPAGLEQVDDPLRLRRGRRFGSRVLGAKQRRQCRRPHGAGKKAPTRRKCQRVDQGMRHHHSFVSASSRFMMRLQTFA